MTVPAEPVIAGVDGSPYSLTAAEWARAEADRRRTALRLVFVSAEPTRAELADQELQEIVQRFCSHAPPGGVTGEVTPGHPVEELLRYSDHAQLVVLGHRGQGGFADDLLGSVASAVASRAACPVVVIRDVPPSTGPIVVGLDGSPGSEEALGFALETAATRGHELLAVQAWQEDALLALPLRPEDRERVRREIEHSVAAQVARWRDRYPGVRIRTLVRRGHPVAALKDAARDAPLLVVGHRGQGGFTGLFVGSVASGLLHHALCPVAVVRTGTGRLAA